MTNKFKFGDKVWHETLGECSVLTLDDEIDNIYKIVYLDSNEDYIAYAHGSKLTLVSDWVKCADKSPPFNTYVLIWDGEDQDVDWLSDTAPNEFKESHITHWMPLPAPPVEVE